MSEVQVPADARRPTNVRVARLGVRLGIATVVPLAVYFLARPVLGSDLPALALGGSIPLLVTGVLSVARRRIEPLFVVTGGAFLVAVVVSIASGGNSVLLKAPDAPLAVLAGLVLFGSVLVRRPLLTVFLRRIGRLPHNVDVRRGAIPTLIVGSTLVVHGVLRIILATELDTAAWLTYGRLVGWAVLGIGLAALILYRRVRSAASATGSG